MKAILEKTRLDAAQFTWQEKLILISIILLFLPFWLSAPIVMGLLFIPLFRRELWPAVIHQKGALWLYGFIFLELAVSAFYGNETGVLNSLGYCLVAVYIAWYRKVVNPKLYYYVIQTFLVMSVFAALWGIIEYILICRRLGVSVFALEIANKPADRVHAMFYNANFYATMLDFFLIFASCSLLKARSQVGRIYFFCLILLNFGMLLLTGCRAALLPIPFYIPVFLWFTNKKKTFWIVLGAEAAVLIMLMVDPTLIPRIEDISTLESRILIWKGALELFSMHPIFGMGPQTYGFMYKELGFKKAPHAHNIYLDTLASYGIAGTVLILGYIQTLIREILSAPKITVMKYYLPMVYCFFISAAIHGLLDCTLNFWQTGMTFFIIINSGCMAYSSGKKKPLPVK